METVRRILLWLTVPLIAVGATVAIRRALTELQASPPSLDCVKEINLGDRERGEIVHCTFRLGNTGQRHLKLEDFQSSCSCAGVEREVDGKMAQVTSFELEPGQRVDLSARVAVGASYGEAQLVDIAFKTNDPAHPFHVLRLTVPRVKGGAYPQPKAVIFVSVRSRGVLRAVVG